MNSFNHYAYGAIGAWLYNTVAGIEIDPDQPGYKHILLQPRPGGGLTYAKASLNTLFGTVAGHWWYENDAFFWKVTVPPNTTAAASVPCKIGQRVSISNPDNSPAMLEQLGALDECAVYHVPSGTYLFTVEG